MCVCVLPYIATLEQWHRHTNWKRSKKAKSATKTHRPHECPKLVRVTWCNTHNSSHSRCTVPIFFFYSFIFKISFDSPYSFPQMRRLYRVDIRTKSRRPHLTFSVNIEHQCKQKCWLNASSNVVMCDYFSNSWLSSIICITRENL